MKILDPQSAVLSNYEVLEHLLQKSALFARRARAVELQTPGSLRPSTRNSSHLPENVNEIIRDTIRDLSGPDAVLSKEAGAHKYSSTSIEALFEDLKEFALEKAELLMILNLRPRNLAELNLVVEELDSRFPEEEEQERIVGIIVKHLGKGLPPVVEGEGGPAGQGVNGTNGTNGDSMIVD